MERPVLALSTAVTIHWACEQIFGSGFLQPSPQEKEKRKAKKASVASLKHHERLHFNYSSKLVLS